jgi:hypothetical protein
MSDWTLSGEPKAIGEVIGASERRAFYLLEKRLIPATKVGESWCASRSALRRHFAAALAEKVA